jgi:hypothetical protein
MYSTHMLPKVYDYAVCSGFVASWTTTSHLQRHVRLSANARGLGTYQVDIFEAHEHDQRGINNVTTQGAGAYNIAATGSIGVTTSTEGGAETRSVNTAFVPFISL